MQMNRKDAFQAEENYRWLRFRRWEIISPTGSSGSTNAIFLHDESPMQPPFLFVEITKSSRNPIQEVIFQNTPRKNCVRLSTNKETGKKEKLNKKLVKC